MRRKWLVWLHRWTGLLMAGFLILEGMTGSILAFRESLDRQLAPQLFVAPGKGVARLGLAALARRAEALAPRARVGFFSVEDRQVVVHMLPRRPGEALAFDRLYLDPWSGRELGRRLEGDLSQGWINVVPFIYRVHRDLAAGQAGVWVLGVVALAWTVDCFVGFYLTLPLVWTRFLARWKTAWLIKWRASAVRVNFDLHRVSGLWLWPLLFVFGWSSVMFNLNSVYEPVTGVLFNYRSGMDDVRTLHLSANPTPRLNWDAAQRAAEQLMALEAARRGFRIERPYGMAYIEEFGVYTYAVAASVNIQHSAWTTSLWLDGNTGALVKLDLPSGEHSGNTVENWLRALHFADLRDSLAYRVLVCALGLVVAVLSVTGAYIWMKKRSARSYGAMRNRVRDETPRAPSPVPCTRGNSTVTYVTQVTRRDVQNRENWVLGQSEPFMRLIDALATCFFPTRRRGALWLREELIACGVQVPLSGGCSDAFVRSAHLAALRDRSGGEPYPVRLEREVRVRAQFLGRWMGSDDTLDYPQWREWAQIARQYALPRAWRLSEPIRPGVPQRPESFRIPEHLVVSRSSASSSSSGRDGVSGLPVLPGEPVLEDLRRAKALGSESRGDGGGCHDDSLSTSIASGG